MLLWVESGVSRKMGVLDGGGYRRTRMGILWANWGRPICNQWGHTFVVV